MSARATRSPSVPTTSTTFCQKVAQALMVGETTQARVNLVDRSWRHAFCSWRANQAWVVRTFARRPRPPVRMLGREMRLAHCHRCVIADLRSLVRHSRCARRGGLWRGCGAIMAAVAPTATVTAIAPAAPVTMPAYSPATTAVTAVAPAARATTAAVARLGGTGRPIQECQADDPKKHGNGKDQLSIHRSIL
jgi:hypothetical protein